MGDESNQCERPPLSIMPDAISGSYCFASLTIYVNRLSPKLYDFIMPISFPLIRGYAMAYNGRRAAGAPGAMDLRAGILPRHDAHKAWGRRGPGERRLIAPAIRFPGRFRFHGLRRFRRC